MADLTVTAASVLASAAATNVRNGIAGETLTAGMPVYIDTADGNSLKKAQATSAKHACVGITTSAAADGQPIAYTASDTSFAIGSTVVVGTVYCVSATAGGICPLVDLVSPDYVTVLGVANTTSTIVLVASAAVRAGAGIA